MFHAKLIISWFKSGRIRQNSYVVFFNHRNQKLKLLMINALINTRVSLNCKIIFKMKQMFIRINIHNTILNVPITSQIWIIPDILIISTQITITILNSKINLNIVAVTSRPNLTPLRDQNLTPKQKNRLIQ